jgi:hypothetical protein
MNIDTNEENDNISQQNEQIKEFLETYSYAKRLTDPME